MLRKRMVRVPGEKKVGRPYLVYPTGNAGRSMRVVLHPSMGLAKGDEVQWSELGDGSWRLRVVRKSQQVLRNIGVDIS